MRTMSTSYLILNPNGTVSEAASANQWMEWYKELENRQVAVDRIGKTTISTVFLGMALSGVEAGNGEPALFETRKFTSKNTKLMGMYATYGAAVLGHRNAVLGVRGGKDSILHLVTEMMKMVPPDNDVHP